MTFDDALTTDLASRAKAGDGAAFDELVRRCDRGFVELATRLLADRDEAEDVRQLAWIRIWRSFASFDERARFTTWAFRIVVNLCRDRQRERARRGGTQMVGIEAARQLAHAAEPGDQLARAELAERVREALAALPDDERECLVLRHYHDLATSEIGDVVGRPRTTVQSCLARALTRLTFRLRPLVGRDDDTPIPQRGLP